MTDLYKKGTECWYKDVRYHIESKGKMKIGQLWIDCIIYKKGSATYVRELKDFEEHFTIIPLETKPNKNAN